MLSALDRLGVVGTRVIGASKDNLLKSLAHLKPVLSQAARRRRQAGPGAQPDHQLPVPQGGLRDRPRRLRQHLDPGRHQPGELPARRHHASRTSRSRTSRCPDLPPAGAGAQRRPEVPAERATSPAPPARRCWPTSTCSTSLKKKCQKDKYAQQPGLPDAQHRARTSRSTSSASVLGGLLGWRRSAASAPQRGRRRPPPRARSTEARHDPRHPDPDRGVPRAQRGRDRLHHRVLPRLRRQGARPRASPCTRPCRPRAASTRAARSPTAA